MRILAALSLFIFFFESALEAQPYVDPFDIRFTHAFKNNAPSGTPFDHLYIGSDIPVRFKNGSIILVSPFYENWNIDSADKDNFLPTVSSIALPVGFIFPLNEKWSFNVTAIPRLNGEELNFNSAFQMGGVAFASYKAKEQKKFRFGLYVNNDFFGVFVIPLAGVDWRIDSNNYLFGLLPGRLTFEHRINDHLYTGGTFRAITNSYRLSNGDYIRIDDNELSAYFDYYLAKHLVVTIEPGYGILRKLRGGDERNKNYTTDYNWNDGAFIKLSASYRIRL